MGPAVVAGKPEPKLMDLWVCPVCGDTFVTNNMVHQK